MKLDKIKKEEDVLNPFRKNQYFLPKELSSENFDFKKFMLSAYFIQKDQE